MCWRSNLNSFSGKQFSQLCACLTETKRSPSSNYTTERKIYSEFDKNIAPRKLDKRAAESHYKIQLNKISLGTNGKWEDVFFFFSFSRRCATERVKQRFKYKRSCPRNLFCLEVRVTIPNVTVDKSKRRSSCYFTRRVSVEKKEATDREMFCKKKQQLRCLLFGRDASEREEHW